MPTISPISSHLLPYTLDNNIAVVSLADADPAAEAATTAHGTLVSEHRLSPFIVLSLFNTLTELERNPEVHCLVVTGGTGKFFCNGFDLKFIHANRATPNLVDDLQQATEQLLALLLKFRKPTVAAVNGHAAAAGAMLLLAFDKVVMNNERGYCFVPGVDLGIVYSPGMTALMAAKLPVQMRTDFIVFGKRYGATELEANGVLLGATKESVMPEAMKIAQDLKKKAAFPEALGRIKECLYHEACAALECEIDESIFNPIYKPMGFGNMNPSVDKPKEAAPQVQQATIESKRRSTLVATQIESNATILNLSMRLATTEEGA